MSHFSVLVITNDAPSHESIEKILQPWHEFECTDIDDEYIQDVDVTEECRKNGLDYYGLDDKTVTSESQIKKGDCHKYGYAIVDSDGKLLKAVNRTNPNKKWDWWEIGGRWSGFLMPKYGTEYAKGKSGLMDEECNKDGADMIRVSDVDIELMRNTAADKAGKKWDRIRGLVGEDLNTFIPWKIMRDEHSGDIEAAGIAYREQPAIIALLKDNDLLFVNLEDFLVSRDEYINSARLGAISTFAFVKDGNWIERGDMGWFGCVSNEQDKNEWAKQFNEMIDNLSPSTWLTVVDCHI